MTYCAICGRDHDPGVSCSASLMPGGRSRGRSFARTKRAADRFMVRLAIVALAVIVVVVVVVLTHHI
jgi:hypothetical protein